jgi:hypothetical protein
METTTKEDQEKQRYGCTLEHLHLLVLFTDRRDPVDLTILAESVLSDAQVLMEDSLRRNGDVSPECAEIVRQYLNRSKYFSSEARRILREAERAEGKAQ